MLAEKVNLSEDAIQKWEVGVNTPPLEAVKQLVNVFMIPVASHSNLLKRRQLTKK